MNRKLIVGLAALTLVTLACALPSINLGGTTGGDAQALFQDDFSDSSSGWADVGYTNGAYVIFVEQTSYDIYDTPGLQMPADVAIEVDTEKVGGPDNNNFGAICRFQDENNYYFLQISSDGFATIGMYLDGTNTYLLENNWDSVSAVRTGDSTNHIRAVCQGNTLTLYANGTQVAQVTDSTFSSGGEVGLMAGTFDEAGTQISFDNFVVTAP